MGAWLKTDLAPVLDRLLSPEVVASRGLFREGVVARLVQDHRANRFDGTDILLALMNLEIWSRIYLDNRSAEDVATELKGFAALRSCTCAIDSRSRPSAAARSARST
jgi:asparagine synthase (glutamine-hydrolysing)